MTSKVTITITTDDNSIIQTRDTPLIKWLQMHEEDELVFSEMVLLCKTCKKIFDLELPDGGIFDWIEGEGE